MAGRRVLDVVAGLGDRDTVLFLISGGGSALVELPAPGVELGDIVETYDLLMRAGVGIDEMNTVRTHLSALKGGRLAAATRARPLTVLVSDVPRGEASSVASGPTVPCRTTPADALDVRESHGLADRVPASVRRQLSSAAAPPSIVGRHLLAADGPMAGRAAVDHALAAGIPARLSEVALHGAAADTARGALATANPGEITAFVGETTVEVRGGGTGGRNQEAALAAALDMVGSPDLFVTFATDGIDGPTDAAGALVGGATLGLVEAAGVDPVLALATNDSYPALAKANCLIRCGPTGTNVADIWLVDRRHL